MKAEPVREAAVAARRWAAGGADACARAWRPFRPGQRQEQLLEVQERGVWITWRLQSSNRAGYLVGGLKPGPGPPAAGARRRAGTSWAGCPQLGPQPAALKKIRGIGVGEMQVK